MALVAVFAGKQVCSQQSTVLFYQSDNTLCGARSAIACLHGWPDRGPWYRRLQKHIHLTSSIVPHTQLNYKVNVLLHFLLRGLALVTGLSLSTGFHVCIYFAYFVCRNFG